MKKYATAVLLLMFSNLFAQTDGSRILNRYIVMLKPQHSIENLLADKPGLKVNRCLSQRMNIWLLERNTISGAEDFLWSLYKSPSVKLAQFDHKFEERALIPDDTYFNIQWSMLNTGQSGGVAGADIQATDAWQLNHANTTVNGDTIVVAVIDGKVDLSHEDLNFFTNYAEVPGNGIDDDQNGYIDDVNGWNVGDTSGNINTTAGNHSTHVAGIVGAIGNNSKGVAGVCWGVKLLPIAYGRTEESFIVAAYSYVREMRMLYDNTLGAKGAFVVASNSSFGLDRKHPAEFPIWCAMYDSMGTAGILSACATANANTNVDAQGDMPTECPSPWMITVTNTNRNDQRSALGAAYGRNTIDLGAPGSDIYSTVPNNQYFTSSGTSMAAPHVAGAIAAMYATACKGLIDAYYERPDSLALIIKDYLLTGAEWVSSLNNMTVTGGRLNLLRAIQNLKKYNCDSCSFNVAMQKTPIACNGDSAGQLEVVVSEPGIYNYVWADNNATASQITNLGAGFYMVTVTDTTGCPRVTTAELHNPDAIFINAINTIPATDSTGGNITIVASAGRDTLMYSLDNVTYQQTPIFSIPQNGTYTVYVKNQEGCIIAQQVIVSSIHEPASGINMLRVYPNPAADVLNVAIETPAGAAVKIFVTDVVGQTVYETTGNVTGYNTFAINTSQLPAGLYYLCASTGKSNMAKRFAIAR